LIAPRERFPATGEKFHRRFFFSTLIDGPISWTMVANLQQAILGIVPLAAMRAGEIAAPGCALAIVVLGDGKRRAAATGHEIHLQARVVRK
jgi:hypothetical protein